MKNFAAYFLPMMSKQAAKFAPGAKLEHFHQQYAALYEELDRRLSLLEIKD